MKTTRNEHLGPIPAKRRRKAKPPAQTVSIAPLEFFRSGLSSSSNHEPAHKKKVVGFKVDIGFVGVKLTATATCSQYGVSASVPAGDKSATLLYVESRASLIESMREADLCVDNMILINDKELRL